MRTLDQIKNVMLMVFTDRDTARPGATFGGVTNRGPADARYAKNRIARKSRRKNRVR